MCLYQKPGGLPLSITGRFVNTATRGWVGATNGRAPFKFHGAVVCFNNRCLSRTRNLAASNKHLALLFSGRSWPKIGPGIIFFGVFEKFETFFSKICDHSERYRYLLAGIFEILTCYGNIAFPLSPLKTFRSFYPMTSAVPPVSFLILHRREIQILWSQTVRQRKTKPRYRIKVGKSSAGVHGTRAQ